MRHKNSTLAFVYNNVHNIVQNVVDINTSGVGTVIKSEWWKANIYMYIYVCVSCEPLNVRRYRGKSFTDLCFCESSKLTRWMRVSFNIQQNKMVWKKKSYLAVRCDRCLDPSTKWMPQHTSRQHLVHQCLTSSSIHRTWIANYISRTWLSKKRFRKYEN